jgi:hypothetical protein
VEPPHPNPLPQGGEGTKLGYFLALIALIRPVVEAS